MIIRIIDTDIGSIHTRYYVQVNDDRDFELGFIGKNARFWNTNDSGGYIYLKSKREAIMITKIYFPDLKLRKNGNYISRLTTILR